MIAFFGLNASMGAMIVMVIFIGMGEKMAERFLPLYLLAIGGTTLSVGFLNAMDNLLSALYSFPGGYLSDRLGYKKALILFTVVAMFGYLIVIFFPSWQAVMVGAIFFISWTAVSLPAIMSMVSKVMPKEKRTMGVSAHFFRAAHSDGSRSGGRRIIDRQIWHRFGNQDGVRSGLHDGDSVYCVYLVLHGE